MVQQLQQRVPLADATSTRRAAVSPLTANEAAQLKYQLDALPGKGASDFVAAIAQAVGTAAGAGAYGQTDGRQGPRPRFSAGRRRCDDRALHPAN